MSFVNQDSAMFHSIANKFYALECQFIDRFYSLLSQHWPLMSGTISSSYILFKPNKILNEKSFTPLSILALRWATKTIFLRRAENKHFHVKYLSLIKSLSMFMSDIIACLNGAPSGIANAISISFLKMNAFLRLTTIN